MIPGMRVRRNRRYFIARQNRNDQPPREFAIGVEGFKGALDKINQNYSTNFFNHESRDGWHLWQILELKHVNTTRSGGRGKSRFFPPSHALPSMTLAWLIPLGLRPLAWTFRRTHMTI